MNKILIANWKANPATLAEAKALFAVENKPGVIICPPSLYIPMFHVSGSMIPGLGAQDVFWEGGAHTGQVSPAMLKECGVSHVLVGHSERRAIGETEEQINKKLKAALVGGLIPVLLIGEPEKGPARSDYLIDQLTRDLEGVSGDDAKKILFCYEPVWAISTNPGAQAATPGDASGAMHEMQSIIEKMYGFRPEILYGGSVNAQNLESFLKHPGTSGALVGGASLKADEFKKMIDIASKL